MIKNHKVGSLFFYNETNWGSGEQGCWQLYRLGRRHKHSALKRVQWLGHTCDARPGRTVSARVDWWEADGQVMWLP